MTKTTAKFTESNDYDDDGYDDNNAMLMMTTTMIMITATLMINDK